MAFAPEEYPWDILNQRFKSMQALEVDIQGSIHPAAHIEGVLSLGEGSVIKSGTLIEGHVRIGKNCSIGPNAYLRGFCDIGDDCRIGHAVEIKDSIIGNKVFISHLSYLGDSILEDDVNIGGGCILSNFRHDAGEIRMPWAGELRCTGRDKLGAYIGHGCRLGCNSVILPGRVLAAHTCCDAGSTIH